MAQQPNSDLRPPPCTIRHTHTHTYTHTHTHSRTPLDEWSARRRCRYLHNTQQTQRTNIQALSGIRTRDPSNWAASDLHLRPQDHCDRLYKVRVCPINASTFTDNFSATRRSKRERLDSHFTIKEMTQLDRIKSWKCKRNGGWTARDIVRRYVGRIKDNRITKLVTEHKPYASR